MKYVLSDVAGENFRMADGMWCEEVDLAERFSFDAAQVRVEELLAEGVHTRIVETHGRKRKTSESIVGRVTRALDKLEQQWEGKTIGIGYEVDVEVGHIILTLQPDDQPELSLNVTVDISGVFVGVGDEN
jgi:fibronectin type 3 domain-containing protein